VSSNAPKDQHAGGAAAAAATAPAVDASAPAAFHELEQLVRHLGDELAGFRRRALQAETRLKTAESELAAARAAASKTVEGEAPHPRVAELERQNDALRRRLDDATRRTRQMIDRVRFLRQQHHQSSGGDK
jgi:uncharacterized protein involved in exopolysaccharide biosynthesis